MKQLFIAFMLSCLLPLAAYADDSGTCGDNLTWTYVEATHTLTISGTGKMPDYSYSSSGPWYSYRTTIKTAIIEEGVTSIGKYAFYGCSGLTSVTIPNSVTIIGLCAFQDCSSLTSITIPNSVTTIGNQAFYECSGLTSVTIPNSVTTIGNNAFLRCRGLTSVSIGNSVTSIGEFAFAVCSSLTSVNIPNSVTTIGPDAFVYCSSLTSITISKGVTSIGNQAFTFCSNLSSITVESDNSVYDSRDNCNAIIETKTNTLIAGCKNTNIPNTVTSIGTSAFHGCEGLTSITIPSTVTTIGKDAFFGCIGLTEIHSYIEEPFSPGVNCWNNINKSIPLYVPVGTKAKYEASDGWKDFTNIIEMESEAPTGNIEFADAEVKRICVENWDTNGDGELSEAEAAAVTALGTVFKSNSDIKSFDELQYFTGLTSITASAFNGSGLTSITIPNSVTSIGEAAFHMCTRLKSISIPNSVTSIEREAFFYCLGLKSLAIPNSVTSIGSSAFSGCSGLTSITIPDLVTSIEFQTFAGCSSLTSITIPNSVTSIGSFAFNLCSSLVELTVENPTPVPIDDQWTFSNRANATLYVPAGSKAAYEAADYWKEFKEIVEREEGITPTDISTLADAIYVTPTTAFKGSEATLTICLKNAQATNAYSFDLLLPEGFSLVKDGDDYYYELSNRHNGHSASVNYNEKAGVYSFAVLSLQSKEIRNNDGAIWTVKLHSADEMAAGSYAVKIQNAKYSLINGSGSVILPEVISLLTVEDCIKGDSNGDGSVDIADAVCIVNYIVGKPAPAFVAKAADANGDGVVDIADAVRIINLIVGKINALARQRQTSLPEPE